LAARFAELISDQAKRQLIVWCEAGVDTGALLFFPLLVLVPRGVAALVSVAGLCAAGLEKKQKTEKRKIKRLPPLSAREKKNNNKTFFVDKRPKKVFSLSFSPTGKGANSLSIKSLSRQRKKPLHFPSNNS